MSSRLVKLTATAAQCPLILNICCHHVSWLRHMTHIGAGKCTGVTPGVILLTAL